MSTALGFGDNTEEEDKEMKIVKDRLSRFKNWIKRISSTRRVTPHPGSLVTGLTVGAFSNFSI